MIVDVLINSCARPDILDTSIKSFRKYIKTSHDLRYVILEDKVDSISRQKNGMKWLEKNKKLFHEIHIADKKMGPGFFFAPTVKLCKTDYFFHLEDDNEFIKEIDIDPMIEVMKNNDYIAEIILRRGRVDKRNNPKDITIDGLELTEFDIFSVATGMFNTKIVKQIIDVAGWKTQLREVQVLGKISKELDFKKYTIGHDDSSPSYIHVGPSMGYRKGAWKDEK